MKLKKIALGAIAVIAIAGTAGWFSLDKETRGLIATVPTNKDLLFWSQPQRDAAFRALDRISLLAKWHDIPAGNTPSALPPGPPLKLSLDVDAYLAQFDASQLGRPSTAAAVALRPASGAPDSESARCRGPPSWGAPRHKAGKRRK